MFYRALMVPLAALLLVVAAAPANAEPLVKLKNLVIDPGHGGDDAGAKNPHLVLEKDLNLQVAITLKRLVEKENGNRVKVSLTRPGRENVSQSERAYAANEAEGELYISIHAASGFSEESRNLGIYISTGRKSASWKTANAAYAEENEKLAIALVESLKGFYKHKSFIVHRGEFIPLFGIDMPAAMVETVSLNDPLDELLMSNKEFVGTMAGALYDAIARYDGSL